MTKQASATSPELKALERKRNRERIWKQIKSDRLIYLLLLPVLAWYIIFAYLPMGGLSLAFKTFRYDTGLWGSPWIGFEHFLKMFNNDDFWNAFKNTLIFSAGKLCFLFPTPVLLAIILNELTHPKIKKVFQTVFTFPHFITWVVLAGILINMFSSNGVINATLASVGIKSTFSPLSTSSSSSGCRPSGRKSAGTPSSIWRPSRELTLDFMRRPVSTAQTASKRWFTFPGLASGAQWLLCSSWR